VKIERFEEIQGWQKARELARMVYKATQDAAFARDRWLCDQIRRAAGSVMANIAEGYDAGSDAELSVSCAMRDVPHPKCNRTYMWRWTRVTSVRASSTRYTRWRRRRDG
jgi:hypothetical protein